MKVGPRWDLQGYLKALDRLTDLHVALQKALERRAAEWKAAREERERDSGRLPAEPPAHGSTAGERTISSRSGSATSLLGKAQKGGTQVGLGLGLGLDDAADGAAGSVLDDDEARSSVGDDFCGSEAPSSMVDSEDLDKLWDTYTISTGGTAASQEEEGAVGFGKAWGGGGGGRGRGGKRPAGLKEKEEVVDGKQMGPAEWEGRWRELVNEYGTLRRRGIWILLEEMEEALKKNR